MPPITVSVSCWHDVILMLMWNLCLSTVIINFQLLRYFSFSWFSWDTVGCGESLFNYVHNLNTSCTCLNLSPTQTYLSLRIKCWSQCHSSFNTSEYVLRRILSIFQHHHEGGTYRLQIRTRAFSVMSERFFYSATPPPDLIFIIRAFEITAAR